MMRLGVLILPLCWALAEGGYKPDPPVDEVEATFNSHPVVLQARKMAKLMKHQDVVSTCRYILFKAPQPFHQAEKSCENLNWPITHKGIGLATVQSEEENVNIRSLIRLAFGIKFDRKKPYKFGNWALIGLSRRLRNDRLLLKDELAVFNSSEWFYQDNQQAQYSNFHSGTPDQQRKGNKKNYEYQNWVQVNKQGYWDDTYDTKSLPYICQYCGKYVVLSKEATWHKAQTYCESVGLKFATVGSKEENNELWYATNMTLGTEIYNKRFNSSNWVWIGEKENNVTGEWEHYDGKSLDYKPNWDYKLQPDNANFSRGAEQNVVAFSRKDGKWDDSFAHKKRPFACMCPRDTCGT